MHLKGFVLSSVCKLHLQVLSSTVTGCGFTQLETSLWIEMTISLYTMKLQAPVSVLLLVLNSECGLLSGFLIRLELNGMKRRLTWEATPRSVHDGVASAVASSDCLVFDANVARLFADASGNLSINVTVTIC